MQDSFSTISAPSHSRSVESHAGGVADGALRGPRRDVEVVASKLRISHVLHVIEQVLERTEQSRSALLGAGSGLRDRLERDLEVRDDGPRALAAQEPGLLVEPGTASLDVARVDALGAR